MPNTLTYSKDGLALTEGFEDVRLKAYRDMRGRLTIGYGHTGGDVGPNTVWTLQQAEQALQGDVDWAAHVVNSSVHVVLTQNEFDALVDFVFNVGSGNFLGSTMLRLLNSGDVKAAALQFECWDHSSGKEVAGLLRRRLAEEALFDKETTWT